MIRADKARSPPRCCCCCCCSWSGAGFDYELKIKLIHCRNLQFIFSLVYDLFCRFPCSNIPDVSGDVLQVYLHCITFQLAILSVFFSVADEYFVFPFGVYFVTPCRVVLDVDCRLSISSAVMHLFARSKVHGIRRDRISIRFRFSRCLAGMVSLSLPCHGWGPSLDNINRLYINDI